MILTHKRLIPSKSCGPFPVYIKKKFRPLQIYVRKIVAVFSGFRIKKIARLSISLKNCSVNNKVVLLMDGLKMGF